MSRRARFGTTRHFAFYMLMASLLGLLLGLAADTWNWSDTVIRIALTVGVIAVGVLSTREVLFQPRPRDRSRSEQRHPGQA